MHLAKLFVETTMHDQMTDEVQEPRRSFNLMCNKAASYHRKIITSSWSAQPVLTGLERTFVQET
jgi:hypothetical protein